jgi:hypothetical protein
MVIQCRHAILETQAWDKAGSRKKTCGQSRFKNDQNVEGDDFAFQGSTFKPQPFLSPEGLRSNFYGTMS